jgi:hypothetical protein
MDELLAFLIFLVKLFIAMLIIGISLLLIMFFLSDLFYKKIFTKIFTKDEDQSKP